MRNQDLPKKADLHCHILPYVDDGAFDLEESKRLLRMFADQNVTNICVTPHLRKGMFETPDSEIVKQFQRLKTCAEAENLKLNLFLSREYHFDALFYELLQNGRLICLGQGNRLLVEFSHRRSFEEIKKAVIHIVRYGYFPLIAHVERCDAMFDNPLMVKELIDLGAKIQVNAGSILGREGRRQATWTKKLLDEHLVHVVASDAHDPVNRPPEHEKCFSYLEKKYGKKYAREVMYSNPLKIIIGK